MHSLTVMCCHVQSSECMCSSNGLGCAFLFMFSDKTMLATTTATSQYMHCTSTFSSGM